MARDVVDDRLIGALHVRALTRAGFDHDADATHLVVQTGTVAALMDGHYDGDLTLGEVLARADHGIGTVQGLDGELAIIDGEAWVAHGDRRVIRVAPTMKTPFAVACRFEAARVHELHGRHRFSALVAALDALVPDTEPVVAVRVDGTFEHLLLRSVTGQQPPYPPLAEVVRHQTEWTVDAAVGSLIGFRFPDGSSGIEVAGYHLHFISDDRTVAGHVLDLTLLDGTARVDGAHELHVEVPAGLSLGEPGALAEEIHAVEGGAGH
jgi:acetolactate decarboxylase